MAVNPHQGITYAVFPYKPDFSDDRTNIGGIDLTKEPHRINEIHELALLPKARNAIQAINAENTAVMTLGCAFGELENYFQGYLEFCFRPALNTSQINPTQLDGICYGYLSRQFGVAVVDYMKTAIVWEVRPATIHGSEPVPVYSVWCRTLTAQDMDNMLTALLHCLHHDFLYLA